MMIWLQWPGKGRKFSQVGREQDEYVKGLIYPTFLMSYSQSMMRLEGISKLTGGSDKLHVDPLM